MDTIKPLEDILDGIEESKEELASEFLEDSNYYIPMDTKKLKRSSYENSKLKEGLIVWATDYARRLFYNPQYNFRKDRNPNARGLWAEVAKRENAKKYIGIVNKTFEKSKKDVFK